MIPILQDALRPFFLQHGKTPTSLRTSFADWVNVVFMVLVALCLFGAAAFLWQSQIARRAKVEELFKSIDEHPKR